MDFLTEALVTYERQILQRLPDPSLPSSNLLVDELVQTWLAKSLFNIGKAQEVGATYLKRQLERVIRSIESAVTDPHEEGVSDALYQLLTELPTLSAREQESQLQGVPQKQLVRYHLPTPFGQDATCIKLLEKPQVIGSGSDTGNRTWEASVRLMHYLFAKPELVRDKKILELGAGSGLLSIFCAVLGAQIVWATDGSVEILRALEGNVQLNQEFWDQGKSKPIVQPLDFLGDFSE